MNNKIENIKNKYNIGGSIHDIPYWAMILMAAAIASGIFIIIYGVDILNVENDSWLYNSGGDLSAHYLGWLYYRDAPWQFPIGLQEGITYPYSFSIVYMDSIPIAALLFKLLSPLLPKTFQYFGIYGLFTFVLQGIIGSCLVFSKTKDTTYGVLGSVFFILSSTVLQRMYAHSALAFHPIILLSIYIYLNKHKIKEKKRDTLYWTLIFALAVSVQAYFFPMVFAFMAAFYLPEIVSSKWYRELTKIVFSLGITILVMYAWGYFYGTHDLNGGGLGIYNSNLNALLDSQGNSYFGKILGITEAGGVWEGYAYLGLGIIVLCTVSLFDILYSKNYKILNINEIPTIILIIVLVCASTFPIFRLGTSTLFTISIPQAIENILGTFRANGRFMWPIMYLIMVGVLIYIHRLCKYKYLIVLVCLTIQILDLSTACGICRSHINNLLNLTFRLQDQCWDKLSYKTEIFFMYDPVGGGPMDVTIPLGKYAADNNMVMNDFYTSRKDSTLIIEDRNTEKENILDGNPSEERIYVFNSVPLEYLIYDTGLNIYEINGIIIGVTDELIHEEKASIEQGVDMLEYVYIYSDIEEYIDPHDHTAKPEKEIFSNEYFASTVTIPAGIYHVELKGDNFDNLEWDVYANNDGIRLRVVNYEFLDEKISFDFIVDDNYSNVTIKATNNGKGEVLLTDITMTGKKSKYRYKDYLYGSTVSFDASTYSASAYVRDGLSGAEDGFSWTEGNEVNFNFRFFEESKYIKGNIKVAGTFNGPQAIEIYVNECNVWKGAVIGSCEVSFVFGYPDNGIANIRIELPNAISPLETGYSSDYRKLALMLETISFEEVNNSGTV